MQRNYWSQGHFPPLAALHLASAIIRRAERSALAAGEAPQNPRPLNPAALTYLNRLSDHLFVMTRLINASADGDVLWVPGGSR